MHKAGSKEEALKALEEVSNLPSFYDSPEELWESIYTTSPILEYGGIKASHKILTEPCLPLTCPQLVLILTEI